jgi:PAS domain S-box-containing protein
MNESVPGITCQLRGPLPERGKVAERLVQLFDAMPQPVWLATADGRLDYGNAQWHELVCVSAGAPLEAEIVALLPPDDQQSWREVWRDALRTGQPYEIEHRIRWNRDGTLHWYLERGVPVCDAAGDVDHWLMTATLIDDHKRVEEELRLSDRCKDEFFNVLLHELRNPLAPIVNALEVLTARGDDPPSVSRASGIIRRQVHQLTRLVDDLFDTARIAHGNVELRTAPTNLAHVMTEAIETSRPLIQSRHHQLITRFPAEPLLIEADGARLVQVMTNLLNNAAKYTDPGGCITITLDRSGDRAIVRVCDTGIGISQEVLPVIFELFAQAMPQSKSSMGGLGVGLTVARRLVELHGGSIVAHSDGPGRGSEFVVRLPLHAGARCTLTA